MTKNSQPAVLELAKIVIIEQIQENVKILNLQQIVKNNESSVFVELPSSTSNVVGPPSLGVLSYKF